MNREELKSIYKKKIFIQGSEKQKRDLEFMFSLENIVPDINDEFEYILVCEGWDLNEKSDKKVIYDYELISLLEFPFEDIKKHRKIAIWGTGYYAGVFCDYLKKKENLKYINCFIDNDTTTLSLEKEGIPVVSSQYADPKEYFIIIATGIEFYKEIKDQIKKKGYKEGDYIYFDTVEKDGPQMFLKTYREKRNIDAVCKNLDHSVRISKTGNMSICCMAYEGIYGNLFTEEISDIWNSNRAKACRLSLMNHTFSFCSTERCPFLSGSEVKNGSVNREKYEFPYREYPDSIAPEVDYSCNLSCPSCRKSVFAENGKDRDEYADMVIDKLADVPSRLIINTVGEIFASKNCRKILENKKIKNRDQLSIYTNGTLITNEILNRLTENYSNLEFAVSIDGATKDTYEKLRRGGDFNRLMEVMESLSRLRKEGKISYLQVNYVVQSDNVMEIDKFVKKAKLWGVDRIAMNGLENWGSFTKEEYDEKSIWRNGAIKEEFLQYFTEEIVKDELINFFNISNYIGAEPKKMYMV